MNIFIIKYVFESTETNLNALKRILDVNWQELLNIFFFSQRESFIASNGIQTEKKQNMSPLNQKLLLPLRLRP